jgi:hypothetical protein
VPILQLEWKHWLYEWSGNLSLGGLCQINSKPDGKIQNEIYFQ